MSAPSKAFEIGYFVYIPGRYVVCLHVSLNSKGLKKPGILASIFNVFAEFEIPVVSVKMPAPKPGENAELSVFADLTGRRGVLRKIVDKIRSLEFVEKVEPIKPLFKGFAVDTTYTRLTLAGGRVIVFREPTYEGLIKGFRKRFGAIAKELLYYIGFEAGRKMYNVYSKMVEEAGGGLNELLAFWREVFRHTGFGAIEHVEISYLTKTAIIRVQDSFECRLFKETGKFESHGIRGFIAGFMSSLFKTKVRVEETKCIAKGDPYCEFIVYGT